jgi:isopentenyldiphosphate isomerase
MDEFIDIVTIEGEPTGKSALKSEIHSKGYYHNTAHVWFYTKDSEILLQQRAASKIICPLLWDVSVAGHIDAGETLKSGALREIKEEIGLDINEGDLFKIGMFECFQSYENGIVDNEFHHTFICELEVGLSALIPQKSEVEALKLVTLEDFKSKLDNSDTSGHFVASNREYYLKVLEAIKKMIA